MRIAFTADEAGFEADEYALVCDVACGEAWLTFQRDTMDTSEDWGIHLEYSGQANGNYGCVAACRVNSGSLSVDLGKQLGALAGVTGFDVSLRLQPQEVEALRLGLRRIFRGHSHLLVDI